jgi:hypothetical protein
MKEKVSEKHGYEKEDFHGRQYEALALKGGFMTVLRVFMNATDYIRQRGSCGSSSTVKVET